MARSYSRDGRGRFSGTGGSKASAKPSANVSRAVSAAKAGQPVSVLKMSRADTIAFGKAMGLGPKRKTKAKRRKRR